MGTLENIVYLAKKCMAFSPGLKQSPKASTRALSIPPRSRGGVGEGKGPFLRDTTWRAVVWRRHRTELMGSTSTFLSPLEERMVAVREMCRCHVGWRWTMAWWCKGDCSWPSAHFVVGVAAALSAVRYQALLMGGDAHLPYEGAGLLDDGFS